MNPVPAKRITAAQFAELGAAATASPRRRTVHALHAGAADGVQRFLNVMQPGTYIRPHRHDDPCKWELSVLLSGRMAMLMLDDGGTVLERVELDAAGPVRGLELAPRTWHTSAVLAPDTVLLEVKPGPYDRLSDKDFAAWAPAEGEAGCAAFEQRFRSARAGECLAAGRCAG